MGPAPACSATWALPRINSRPDVLVNPERQVGEFLSTAPSRVTVIAGGAVELGRACTLRAAKPGSTVLIVDEDAARVREMTDEAAAQSAIAVGVAMRLDDLEGLRELPARLPEGTHHVDSLINCQLALDSSTASGIEIELWERVLRVNLTGSMVLAQAFNDLLAASRTGSIVNIGTIDGLQGNPSLPAYSSAKGGLVALTHVMAHDYGQRGVRVNYVARCATKEVHALLAATSDTGVQLDFEEKLAALTPLERLGRADETAAVVEFLCSREASFVNGAVLTVDGGRSGITPGTY